LSIYNRTHPLTFGLEALLGMNRETLIGFLEEQQNPGSGPIDYTPGTPGGIIVDHTLHFRDQSIDTLREMLHDATHKQGRPTMVELFGIAPRRGDPIN
jgi:hypothetical protein